MSSTDLGRPPPSSQDRRRRLLPLVALMAICLAPVVASYWFYYVSPPSGRSNYGELIEPQLPVPALTLRDAADRSLSPDLWRGRWTLVQVDDAVCAQACQRKLWHMRQVRLTTGKDQSRVARVWLIPGRAGPQPQIAAAYDGTLLLLADRAQLEHFLPLPSPAARLEDHIWLVDPNGNLMLRWPSQEDPQRMKRDLAKLLRASRIG